MTTTTTEKDNKKQVFFGFILLAILAIVGYVVAEKIWNILSYVDPKLGAALIAASATILVSVFTVIFSKYLERRSQILTQLREKKIPTYEKLINLIFGMVFSEKLGKKQLSEKELLKTMAEITQELIIWGSDEMIDAFYRFRIVSIENKDPYDILFAVEDLLLAIRKDLGHKNKEISRGKILGLFINDLPKQM
ncbi:hypothetical protein [Nitratifractor sp.]